MLNNISLMGRLVADPELRKTASGISTTTFTVACERSYVKQGEQRQTDFFELVAWRNTAEFICRFFRKGQLIAVDGLLQTRSYEDKEGKRRKITEILVNNAYFADFKGSEKPSFKAPENENALNVGDSDDFTEISEEEDLPF